MKLWLLSLLLLVAEGGAQDRPRTAVPAGVNVTRDVAYAATDNPRQKLDLFLPQERKGGGRLPVIVFVHGGGWAAGDKSGGAGQLGRFVASGEYAGVSIGYRLTNEAIWPAQLHDCQAAIRWIKAHADEHQLDAAKIGVWGSSAGGHLVSLLGTTADVPTLDGKLGPHPAQDLKVSCVVNFFGPENFVTMVQQDSVVNRTRGANYPEAKLLGGAVPEKESLAREASPVTHVSAGDAPFLTAHGTEDKVVPFPQGEEIHAALTKAEVPSIFIPMKGGGHGFRSEELERRVAAFFARHLRGEKNEISAEPIPVEGRPR